MIKQLNTPMPSPPSGPQPEQCSRNRLKSVQLLNFSQCCRNPWRAGLFSSHQTQEGVSREKPWGSSKWKADSSREDTAELPPFSISIGSTIPRGNSLVSYTALREIDPATESKAWEHGAQGLQKAGQPLPLCCCHQQNTSPHPVSILKWSASTLSGNLLHRSKEHKGRSLGTGSTILNVASTAFSQRTICTHTISKVRENPHSE